MSKNDIAYFGTYCDLTERSGDSGIMVDGNMMGVGAELELTPQLHVTEKGKEIPRVVVSKGQHAYGFIPDNVFKQHVKPALDKGWTVRVVMSLVTYHRLEELYVGEVAVFCYDDEHKETFDRFVDKMTNRIAAGEHPAVALSPKEVERVVESKGEWVGTDKVQLADLPKGSVYYKTKRTVAEKAALGAATGNKGCYVALIGVVVVIIALILILVFR